MSVTSWQLVAQPLSSRCRQLCLLTVKGFNSMKTMQALLQKFKVSVRHTQHCSRLNACRRGRLQSRPPCARPCQATAEQAAAQAADSAMSCICLWQVRSLIASMLALLSRRACNVQPSPSAPPRTCPSLTRHPTELRNALLAALQRPGAVLTSPRSSERRSARSCPKSMRVGGR